MLSPTVLLRHPTILVVDDEEPLRRYMSRVMEDGGYRCLSARDGVEALLLLELDRFPVQLVITDVSMPRMSGPERTGRRDGPGQERPGSDVGGAGGASVAMEMMYSDPEPTGGISMRSGGMGPITLGDGLLRPRSRGRQLMGMAHPAGGWTAEMVRTLPDDGKRYEVVDGELLVTPSPVRRHQRMVAHLLRLLADYAEQGGFGEALCSPADIGAGERTVVQPDLFVVPLTTGQSAEEWVEVRELLLAVEVLSPSTARADRHLKRRLYQREGVPECWIVDLDARLIERGRPGEERAELLADELLWQPVAAVPPLRLDLPQLFGRIDGTGSWSPR
jgi:Uma2 family endonuclease